VSHPVASELHQVNGVLPRRAVIADEVLDNHQVVAVSDTSGMELESGRVLSPPFPEVLHAFEPFSGLGKLKHSVVVVDPVGDVLILVKRPSLPLARA
jgi:hypothetical protein